MVHPSRSVPSLRERNRQRTLDEIARVALRLFAAAGFDTVTVDDIAAAAGIGRRTFFRYFETKEDVLLPYDPGRLPELQEALEARPLDEPVFDSVRHAVLALAEGYEHGDEDLRLRFRLVLETPAVHARALGHQAAWEELVRGFAATRLGESEDALVPHLLAATCMAALRAALATWLADDGAEDPVVIAARALDVLAPAFTERRS